MKTATPKPPPKGKIVITIEGGAVQDVSFRGAAKNNVTVEILDFDVQEDSGPMIRKNRQGQPYQRMYFG